MTPPMRNVLLVPRYVLALPRRSRHFLTSEWRCAP